MNNARYSIRICDVDECIFPENIRLRKILKEEISNHQLESKAQIDTVGCTGHCAPFFVIEELGGSRFIYSNLTAEKVKKIINEHIINDKPVMELAVHLG